MRLRLPRLIPLLLAVLAAAPLTSTRAQGNAASLLRGPIAEARATYKQALVVGAGNYLNLDKMFTPGIDARNMAAFLETRLGFPRENINLMTDFADPQHRPDYKNLVLATESLVDNVIADSVVVVYFSGHGARAANKDDYLLPLDAANANGEENGVNLTDLLRRIEGKRPRYIVVFLDTSRKLKSMGFDRNVAQAHNWRQAIVFYAAAADENSFDGNAADFTGGVFTQHLLRALGGQEMDALDGKGVVTADGLRGYLQRKTRSYVREKHSAGQTPDGIAPNPTTELVVAGPPPMEEKPMPPARPTGLSATANPNAADIVLSWTDNSKDETGFKIERTAEGSVNYTQVQLTGPNITTFTDRGLEDGKTYFYRIRATNMAGDSPYSDPASAKTAIVRVGFIEVAQNGTKKVTSISEALLRAAPGARIMVHPGIYKESIVIDQPNLEIIGVERPEDTVISGLDGQTAVTVKGGSVNFKNLTIRGFGGANMAGHPSLRHFGLLVSDGEARIDRCRITADSIAGLMVNGKGRVTLDRSTVYDCKGLGIWVRGECQLTMTECEVVNSAYSGIVATEQASLNIQKCKVTGNGRQKLEVDKTGGIKFAKSGRMAGIELHDRASGTVSGNDLRGNAEAAVDDETGGKVKRDDNKT